MEEPGLDAPLPEDDPLARLHAEREALLAGAAAAMEAALRGEHVLEKDCAIGPEPDDLESVAHRVWESRRKRAALSADERAAQDRQREQWRRDLDADNLAGLRSGKIQPIVTIKIGFEEHTGEIVSQRRRRNGAWSAPNRTPVAATRKPTVHCARLRRPMARARRERRPGPHRRVAAARDGPGDEGGSEPPPVGGLTDDDARLLARRIAAAYPGRLTVDGFYRATAPAVAGLDADAASNFRLRVFISLDDPLRGSFTDDLASLVEARNIPAGGFGLEGWPA